MEEIKAGRGEIKNCGIEDSKVERSKTPKNDTENNNHFEDCNQS